jgi:hypothetical protein
MLFGWLIFTHPFYMMRDIPSEILQPLKTIALVSLCCIPVMWGLTRYARWGHMLVAFLLIPAGVGLAHAAALPPTSTMLALQGRSMHTAEQKKEVACLQSYLTKYKGGQVVLTVGRPGYLLQEHFAHQGNFLHRLELWDLESFLQINSRRDVCLVLTKDQVMLWEQRLGSAMWNQLLLEDKTWGEQANTSGSQDWKVYFCIRPTK